MQNMNLKRIRGFEPKANLDSSSKGPPKLCLYNYSLLKLSTMILT